MLRQDQRRPIPKWTLQDDALKLTVRSTNILSGKRYTDRPQFADITSRMQAEALRIYHNIRVANDKDVRKENEAKDRIRLQDEAVELCEFLITDIELSKKLVHMSAKQATSWTDDVREIRDRIKGWQRSDLDRNK